MLAHTTADTGVSHPKPDDRLLCLLSDACAKLPKEGRKLFDMADTYVDAKRSKEWRKLFGIAEGFCTTDADKLAPAATNTCVGHPEP